MKVADNAKICEAFSREGWCDKAEGTCEDLHGWECGEWRETGKCSRGKGCGLRHILRVAKGVDGGEGGVEIGGGSGLAAGEVVREGEELPVEGGFDDGGEFIGFGLDVDDQSSVSEASEEESGEEESGEEDEGENEDEDEDEEGKEDAGMEGGSGDEDDRIMDTPGELPVQSI